MDERDLFSHQVQVDSPTPGVATSSCLFRGGRLRSFCLQQTFCTIPQSNLSSLSYAIYRTISLYERSRKQGSDTHYGQYSTHSVACNRDSQAACKDC